MLNLIPIDPDFFESGLNFKPLEASRNPGFKGRVYARRLVHVEWTMLSGTADVIHGSRSSSVCFPFAPLRRWSQATSSQSLFTVPKAQSQAQGCPRLCVHSAFAAKPATVVESASRQGRNRGQGRWAIDNPATAQRTFQRQTRRQSTRQAYSPASESELVCCFGCPHQWTDISISLDKSCRISQGRVEVLQVVIRFLQVFISLFMRNRHLAPPGFYVWHFPDIGMRNGAMSVACLCSRRLFFWRIGQGVFLRDPPRRFGSWLVMINDDDLHDMVGNGISTNQIQTLAKMFHLSDPRQNRVDNTMVCDQTEDSMILWFQFEAPWIVQDAKTYQDPILLRSMPDTLADFQDEHFDSGIETFGGQISELPSAATNLLCRALPWTPSMESNPRAKLHIETCNCGNECESTNPLLSSLNVQMWRQRRSMAWISLVRVKVKSGRVTIWASEGQLPFTWQLQTLGGSEARRALFFGESSNGRHSELPDHLFSFTIDSHYNLFDT
ncbi:hypothetical protein C8J56DRAFT_880780 [Mycena floridula]|nr:hypothetical protein C8J56DRAFT_880780 [Mycena floridula]